MNWSRYFEEQQAISYQYTRLKTRARKHHDNVIQNAYQLALRGGWRGPKPGEGFESMFHNWVRCAGFKNPRYDNQIMYHVDQILQRQWLAYRITNRWYDRKMRDLRAQLD